MFELLSILAKGGPVMIPLLLCSAISLAVTIERIIFWRRIKIIGVTIFVLNVFTEWS